MPSIAAHPAHAETLLEIEPAIESENDDDSENVKKLTDDGRQKINQLAAAIEEGAKGLAGAKDKELLEYLKEKLLPQVNKLKLSCSNQSKQFTVNMNSDISFNHSQADFVFCSEDDAYFLLLMMEMLEYLDIFGDCNNITITQDTEDGPPTRKLCENVKEYVVDNQNQPIHIVKHDICMQRCRTYGVWAFKMFAMQACIDFSTMPEDKTAKEEYENLRSVVSAWTDASTPRYIDYNQAVEFKPVGELAEVRHASSQKLFESFGRLGAYLYNMTLGPDIAHEKISKKRGSSMQIQKEIYAQASQITKYGGDLKLFEYLAYFVFSGACVCVIDDILFFRLLNEELTPCYQLIHRCIGEPKIRNYLSKKYQTYCSNEYNVVRYKYLTWQPYIFEPCSDKIENEPVFDHIDTVNENVQEASTTWICELFGGDLQSLFPEQWDFSEEKHKDIEWISMWVNLVFVLTNLPEHSKFSADWMKTDKAWINTERLSLLDTLITQAKRVTMERRSTSKDVTFVGALKTILEEDSTTQSMTQINSSIVEVIVKCIVDEENDIMSEFDFGTKIDNDEISDGRDDMFEKASKILAQKNRLQHSFPAHIVLKTAS